MSTSSRQRIVEAGDDLRRLQVLILDVDRSTRGIDCGAVLIEDRSFTQGDVEDAAAPGAATTVRVSAGVNGPLHLNERSAARGLGECVGNGQIVFTATAPSAVALDSLTRLVPSLDEIVVDVDRRRATHLDVHIVILSIAAVSRNGYRMRVEVDPADKRGFPPSPPASISQVF